MANLFRSTPIRRPKRNAFDLSHDRKHTQNMSEIIPILCESVVPGDKFKLNTEILVRMAPSLAPIMHRVNVFTHFFFVPNRLIWNDWERFITQGANGEQTVSYPLLEVNNQSGDNTLNSLLPGGLYDHLGFQALSSPTSFRGSVLVDLLPFRAYQLIYDCYYRDQNLEDPITEREWKSSVGSSFPSTVIPFNSGTRSSSPSSLSVLQLRSRSWEKDYFTSALPNPQRGGDVTLPMSGDAPVVLNPVGSRGTARFMATGSSTVGNSGGVVMKNGHIEGDSSSNLANSAVSFDPNGSLSADLSNVTSATINDLRRAVRLQEFLEKNARGGSRYIEQILSHFGVRSSDSRLQRPEYLGGGISPVIVSPINQTSASTADSPLGSFSGQGISAQVTHQFKRFFEEHGYIIGVMTIMPKPAYMTGTRRQFLRRDPYDFYWPEFANLGEQAIVPDELYTDYTKSVGRGLDPSVSGVFGYTPRYAEYKFIPSTVHGEFLTNLNYWHLARNFDSTPTLSKEFLTSGFTMRAWPDTTDYSDKFWINIHHNIQALRPMPKFGVPIL